MTRWQSGRESELLDAILDGRKTIEGRLNKGKFAQYKPDDTVSLRRDFRDDDGRLLDGPANAALVEVVAIREYPSFISLVQNEGYTKVIPSAKSAKSAADVYNRYYSKDDQEQYGVLAIEVRPIYQGLSAKTKKIFWLAFIIAAIVLFTALIVTQTPRFQNLQRAAAAHDLTRPFPVIPKDTLSPLQTRIIEILQRQYETQPTGTTYTERQTVPWCADFVSWVMKEAGVPLVSPDTGSWRVETLPGLKKYYQSTGRFVTGSETYTAKTGDVLLFKKGSAFGEHTNIVIKNDNGTLTTVGGNEGDKIRVQMFELKDITGLVGYGKLQ